MSHETIYRSLYVQARGALNKELIQHLRTQRTMRRSIEVAPPKQPFNGRNLLCHVLLADGAEGET